jgi:hypothetical protein
MNENDVNTDETMTMKRVILTNASEAEATVAETASSEQPATPPQSNGRARSASVRRIIVILFPMVVGMV